MPREEKPANESFEEQLSRLRMRIDLLPAEQRSHLYELAETIAWQHRQMLSSARPVREAAEPRAALRD